MFLTDLTFVQEIMDKTGEDQELINFPKFKLLFETIEKLCKYQDSVDYKFDKNPLQEILYEPIGLSRNECTDLSYIIEPKVDEL